MATTMLKIGAPPRRPKNSSGSLCAVTVVSTAVRLALRARRLRARSAPLSRRAPAKVTNVEMTGLARSYP